MKHLGRNFLAAGRLPTGTMNKTETAYSRDLELLRAAGEVLWFGFEAIKLRLADNTFLTPDFAVIAKDTVLEFHDTKSFVTEDARIKIKVAAEKFPFRFKIIKAIAKRDGGGWSVEEF
jgi:hypothetical protein